MKRATHYGTCQCCGATQKLPGGLLSNHGYRVLWNEFVGVCAGAGHQPYEESCALIATFVERATEQREVLEQRCDALLGLPTEPRAWYREYHQGAYRWIFVDLLFENDKPYCPYYINQDGRTRRIDVYGCYSKSKLEVAQRLNAARVKEYEGEIASLRRYIAWQRERITAWEPRPLTPVTEKLAPNATRGWEPTT